MPESLVEHFQLLDAEDGVIAQLFLDAEELVVFRDPVRTAHGTGLDLAAVSRDGEVGDGAVFGFTGAVAEDGGVAVFLGEFDGIEGLGEGSDLVHLDEDGVCDAHLDALAEEIDVGDEQVVADELGGLAEFVGDDFPTIPVVLGATVFDRDDGIALLEIGVEIHQFGCGLHRTV